MRTLLAGLAIGVLAVAPSFAQSVISAHSGVIHYTEGKILVDDKVLETKTSEFADLKNNGILRTQEGRAEILLTPGVFLRIGENSAVKMLSNRLSDTRVEVLSGEALVECDEILKDNAVTVVYKNTTVAMAKRGLYDFDASLGRLRVYDGEVVVKNPSGQLTAKKGHEVNLTDGPLMSSKFDTKVGDPLVRWAARRSGYISMANVAAARSANGYSSGYYGGGGWAFNPWFGMYTFIPGAGITYSPFGYPFWSPYASMWYAPYYGGYYGYYPGYYPGYYGGGGGGSTVSSFHPGARAGASNPYSNSGTARSAPGGVTGGFGGGRSSGGFGSSGGMSSGGFTGGSYGGGGGGGVSGGGGMSGGGGASAGGGGGASAGGGGGHGGGGGGHR